jgi:hypothetical protein
MEINTSSSFEQRPSQSIKKKLNQLWITLSKQIMQNERERIDTIRVQGYDPYTVDILKKTDEQSIENTRNILERSQRSLEDLQQQKKGYENQLKEYETGSELLLNNIYTECKNDFIHELKSLYGGQYQQKILFNIKSQITLKILELEQEEVESYKKLYQQLTQETKEQIKKSWEDSDSTEIKDIILKWIVSPSSGLNQYCNSTSYSYLTDNNGENIFKQIRQRTLINPNALPQNLRNLTTIDSNAMDFLILQLKRYGNAVYESEKTTLLQFIMSDDIQSDKYETYINNEDFKNSDLSNQLESTLKLIVENKINQKIILLKDDIKSISQFSARTQSSIEREESRLTALSSKTEQDFLSAAKAECNPANDINFIIFNKIADQFLHLNEWKTQKELFSDKQIVISNPNYNVFYDYSTRGGSNLSVSTNTDSGDIYLTLPTDRACFFTDIEIPPDLEPTEERYIITEVNEENQQEKWQLLLHQRAINPTSNIEESCITIICASGNSNNYFFGKHKTSLSSMVRKPVLAFRTNQDLNVNLEVDFVGTYQTIYPRGEVKDSNLKWLNCHVNTDNIITYKNKQYPYLFWDGISNTCSNLPLNEGFCVHQDNIIEFLEKQCHKFGFDKYLRTDFVTFWTPILEQSKYCLIRFLTPIECDEIAKLSLTSNTDNSIIDIVRMYMIYTPCDHFIEMSQPQEIEIDVAKSSCVLFEWGGFEKV